MVFHFSILSYKRECYNRTHAILNEIESKQKQTLTTILQTTIKQGSEFRHIIGETKYTKDIPEQFEFITHSNSANIWILSFSIVS